MSKNLSQEQANMAVAVALQREVADLQRQLAEAKAEIEAMQPMVEACKARHEHHLGGPIIGEDDPCPCITCQWYRDYLERKQP